MNDIFLETSAVGGAVTFSSANMTFVKCFSFRYINSIYTGRMLFYFPPIKSLISEYFNTAGFNILYTV